MRGIEVRDNPMGMRAIRVHYTADPAKDPEHPDPAVAALAADWLAAQRMIYPDPNTFAQEMEINFFVGSGARVYPEFTQALHCQPLLFNPRKVVYRGWDFGYLCPVAILGQIDRDSRLLIVKEIIGRNQTTHEFAGAVIKQCAAWLPQHAPGYEDWVDPAGQQVQTIESERSERRDTEILAGLGLYPRYEYGWSRKDGRTLVHRCLGLRTDGSPGLWVDSAGAPTVAQAFLGRYVYPETRDGRIKEEPDDLSHPWADVMAAVRYLVTGLHGRLGLPRFGLGQSRTPKPIPAYTGYGVPTP